MPPAILTPVLISAAVGAVTAAISGGNILKGALLGAVGGGIGAAFLGAGAGTAGGAAGADAAAGSALGAATEPVASIATSGAGSGAFLGEAPWTASGGGALDFGATASPVTPPTSLSEMATTLGNGGGSTTLGAGAGGEIGVQAPQAIYQGGGESGLFNAAKDSQLASAELGLGPDSSLGSAAVPTSQPSAIESMWERVFGKDGYLDKPGTRGLVGAGLKGMAEGMGTQKKLDYLREQEERARQNARFGTQTSRFAPIGLVSKATTPYRG